MYKTKRILQRNISNAPQNNVTNTFSFRLSYAMAIRKISQAELASACGLAPSNISQYLNKNATPRIDKIRVLAESLSVSELWLIGDGAPADIDTRQNLDALSPDERTILKLYQGVDWKVKKFLLDLVKSYEKLKKDSV